MSHEALGRLRAEGLSDAQRRRRQADLADRLRAGARALQEARVRRIPVDLRNALGLARAQRYLGNADAARRQYARIVRGLRLAENAASRYWPVQLEYARFLLENFAEDASAMRSLVVRIDQLRAKDPLMGGLREGFNVVRLQAVRRAR